jgi:hypothetical protein
MGLVLTVTLPKTCYENLPPLPYKVVFVTSIRYCNICKKPAFQADFFVFSRIFRILSAAD